jgi:hypothetical protein
MTTLTEVFELWRVEHRGIQTIRGWGRLNAKLCRYYEVRCEALELLLLKLFSPPFLP